MLAKREESIYGNKGVRCPQPKALDGAGSWGTSNAKVIAGTDFDRHFSPNSYGFRPGRSQHQAVEAAQQFVNSGNPYVVDIDLSNFFDRIHHDLLIARMGQKVTDKLILRLVGLMLLRNEHEIT
jgi:retron-type reverse transcriptase